MLKNRITKNKEEGFTLVELSIVLVIIGLIVGGVLTGQDLIKAAQVRAEVSQITQYSTATNTFHEKYNGLPGDLLSGSNYFSGLTSQSAAAGWGNGDGLIEASGYANGATSATNLLGEPVVFWYELNAAGLIPDPTIAASGYAVGGTLSNSYLPIAKIPGGTMISVIGANGINYWTLANFNSSTVAAPVWGPGLSVLQASQLDGKIDDGNPSVGNVLSVVGSSNIIPGAAGDFGTAGSSTGCTITGGTAYNVAGAGNAVNCVLTIKSSF